MSGIGVILNPHSRSNRRNPERAKRLGFIVGDRGSCHETRDIEDVAKLARHFRDKQIDILGISGGDGTNHATLSTFIDVYGDVPLPKIAFLRGGTMNTIANALKIKGSPEEILSHLIFKYHEGSEFHTTDVDLINVNGKYGFLFGMGIISRFLEVYNRRKGRAIYAGALLAGSVLSAVFNGRLGRFLTRRYDARVTADGKEWPFKNYMTIFGGTVESFGLGFTPLPRAREKERHFHITGLSMTPRQMVARFPLLFMGKPLCSHDVMDYVSQTVTMELPSPEGYMIDGDLFPPTNRIDISIGPRVTLIIN